MKTWQSTLLGIILGTLFSAVILLVAQQPRGQAILLVTVPAKRVIYVHISGGVSNPGLLELSSGSHLADAVQAAGGLTEDADINAINLASILADGEKVVVPQKKEPTSTFPQRSSELPLSVTPSTQVKYPININTASTLELEILPGIGSTKAQQIVLYRQEHGPFKTIEEIQNVPGIGAATFDRIKDLITVTTVQ